MEPLISLRFVSPNHQTSSYAEVPMYRNSLVFAVIVVLAGVIAWQTVMLNGERSRDIQVSLSELDQKLYEITVDQRDVAQQPSRSLTQSGSIWANQTSRQIDSLLKAGQWQQAVTIINDVYSQANSQQLTHFRSIVLATAKQLSATTKQSARDLLLAYAEAFDDVDAWRQLGSVSAELGDWDTAVTALLASSAQEYDPQAYEASLRALLRAASYARATLEQRSDQLSILAMYQRLYDSHPSYARFQLELAQAHLRLNDYQSASSYLDPLVYDIEFGAIAQQLLANINSSLARQEKTLAPIEPVRQSDSRASDIRIPLVHAGNSLLVDVAINSTSMRLLLDTGASITSLTSDTIRRLGLTPTGRSISLSTANGLTQSPLHSADRLNLGPLRLSNLLVAEVDFGRTGRVQGLLGTDVLKQLSREYSYLIDDQQKALIFRKR
ncbi:MAG: putative aspartyl protease [Arenicella sp.]|jgi:predicted aspartyl protease